MAGAVRCQSGQSKFFLLRFAGAGAWQSCEVADVVPAARESPPPGLRACTCTDVGCPGMSG